jgi:hypothetical protein
VLGPNSRNAFAAVRPSIDGGARRHCEHVGDEVLRSVLTKRVADAVGEGSAAIRSVHEHLALTVDA